MLLRVDVEERADHAVISATGEIDAGNADEVGAAVEAALADGQRRILLDFAQVTFIDSSGLGMLVRSHRQAEAAQATFAVVRPSVHTRKLIRVLGLDQLLAVYDTEEEALSDHA
jgi:anti-anti-sigma factor